MCFLMQEVLTRLKQILMIFLFGWAISLSSWGQDLQTRIIFHPTAKLRQDWYLTCWSITNLRQQSPSNTNLFAGLGYRGKTWWLEGMWQQQWNRDRRDQLLDFRFQKNITNRATLYAEPAIFLTKTTFYDFVILEYRAWRKLSLGMETENVHKAGPDSWGAGPRLSHPITAWKDIKVALALSYQVRARREEKDALRLYLILNHRLR